MPRYTRSLQLSSLPARAQDEIAHESEHLAQVAQAGGQELEFRLKSYLSPDHVWSQEKSAHLRERNLIRSLYGEGDLPTLRAGYPSSMDPVAQKVLLDAGVLLPDGSISEAVYFSSQIYCPAVR